MIKQTTVVVTAPRSSVKKTLLKGAAIALAACASPAFATEAGGIDVSGAITIIASITAAVAAIGAAKLAPAATSVAFKWAKGALFS